MTCSHEYIQPVAYVKQRTLQSGYVKQYIDGDGFQCLDCHQSWPYRDPEDLPQWLYERLKQENRQPMPRLTPEIMDALERHQQMHQLSIFWPVET